MLYKIFKIKKELRKYIKYMGRNTVKVKGFIMIKIYGNNDLIFASYLPKKRDLFDFIDYCKQEINLFG